MNARSEFVLPTNFPDGFVVDTSFMFHSASPASYMPPFSPTRGSGLGAAIDIFGDGAPPAIEDDDDAHADSAAISASITAGAAPRRIIGRGERSTKFIAISYGDA